MKSEIITVQHTLHCNSAVLFQLRHTLSNLHLNNYLISKCRVWYVTQWTFPIFYTLMITFHFELTWVTEVSYCYFYFVVLSTSIIGRKRLNILAYSLELLNHCQPNFGMYRWRGVQIMKFMTPAPRGLRPERLGHQS